MRRFSGFLLLAALAIPASLALPSTTVAAGRTCAMACEHGTGMACCCASGGGDSLRRCPSPGGWFLPSSAMRAVARELPSGPAALPLSGFLALMTAGFVLSVLSERPDPVPKLLS
jgi:hypothetical protein